jgi:D-alanyl-lipoteichoic acid acyltransferase DltB (MBOAT superfamily)
MSQQVIDITDPWFWGIFLVAVAILTPLTHAGLRRLVLAAVNLGFLSRLLTAPQFAALAASLFVVYLVLKGIESGRWRGALVGVVGVVTLGLFLLHKLPGLGAQLDVSALNPVLVVIGFSYVWLRLLDVTRAVQEKRHPAPGLLATVNYLLPFHMLVAGPIQSFDDFIAQPDVPKPLSLHEAMSAADRIARGLFKKFVLAFMLQKLFLTGSRAYGPYQIFEAQIFFLWLYLDFSALSDLAVGMGICLGVATPENFNHPLLARNVIDYWERWHISLSQFIRRNIFIPTQLWLLRLFDGRHILWCSSLSFLVSFLLCGLWHGISPGFAVWGALQAAGLIVTNLWRHILTRRLGAKGLKQYLSDRRIRVAASLVTFEFNVCCVAVLTMCMAK